MPGVSIKISAQDSYSSVIKTMAGVTQSFSKDAEEMERTLHKLNTNKNTLKLDADSALKALKETQREFAKTGKEADGLKVQLAQANYDNVKRNLDLVTKGARAAETQMQQTGEAFRKAENRGEMSGAIGALATTGIMNMLGDSALVAGNAFIGSALGDSSGTIASSALSMAISGAAMGSIIPGIGTAVGAAIGAGAGILSGAAQNFQKKDDAFKSYVQEQTESQLTQRNSDIQSGSGIASQREQDAIAFNQLLGDGIGDKYLSDVRVMAANTPMEYGDLTAMSKAMSPYYKEDPEKMLGTMDTFVDAGSAVGIDAAGLATMASAMGMMESSGKVSLEYLKMFQERGVDVIGMLGKGLGKTSGQIYTMISKGQIDAVSAMGIIRDGMDELYDGASEKQAQTFGGLTSTLSDAQKELQNSYGEGYNEIRKPGIQREVDYLTGESGIQMQEMNKVLGAFQAGLENSQEQFIRDAQDAVLADAEYQKLVAEGTEESLYAAGNMLMAAKVEGQNKYNASEGAQLVLQSELSLAETIREDTASNDAYWNAGRRKSQEYSKGLATGIAATAEVWAASAMQAGQSGGGMVSYMGYSNYVPGLGAFASKPPGKAFGMDRVPYDNFPVRLHQGERVLTASQARQQDAGAGGGVVVKNYGPITVREEADIQRVASELARQITRANMLQVPQ